MDLLLFFSLSLSQIPFFPELFLYWSLVPSTNEIASGGPDSIVVSLAGALCLFLPYVLLGFLPDLVESNVLDL